MKTGKKAAFAMETVVKWILILLGLGVLMGIIFLARKFIIENLIGGI